MDNNLIQNLFINPIFQKGDIYSEFLNYNNESNLMIDNTSVNSNLEPFDNFLHRKHSLNSSIEDNNNKKTPLKTNINNMPNSDIAFLFNSKNDSNNHILLNKNNNKSDKTKEEKIENKIVKKRSKILFNSFMPNTVSEAKKQSQKIKNKISARKSRLKKKLYIEELEKQYDLVKNELYEIKQELGIFENNVIHLNENGKIVNKNKIKNKFINGFSNYFKIEELKHEENEIINEKIKESNNINKIYSFTSKQKIFLEQLLVSQIEIMMPIKVKIFRNKYLKLLTINKDDSISVIKNKIEENLKSIEEVYNVNKYADEYNGGTKVQNDQNNFMRNKSMPYQIYNFYKNLRNYVNEFEKIYISLD